MGWMWFIFLLPESDTVIVTAGSNYDNDFADILDLINRYILGAVYGDYKEEAGNTSDEFPERHPCVLGVEDVP